MIDTFINFFSTTIKLFALMTPTAALSAFISSTKKKSDIERKAIAVKCSTAIFIMSVVLLLFGNWFFFIFDFTIDSFRIGAGALLFLTAINLMNGNNDTLDNIDSNNDISIVPLAIPLSLGPATIGAIIVMGSNNTLLLEKGISILSLLIATMLMYLCLRSSSKIIKLIKQEGIEVMSKITGLILSAIAAQAFFTGVASFLK